MDTMMILTALALGIATVTSHSAAFQCFQCESKCSAHKCSTNILTPETGTKFLCATYKYSEQNKEEKSCAGDRMMQELVGGNDNCRSMEYEMILKLRYRLDYPSASMHTQYRDMTEEQYITNQMRNVDRDVNLKENVTVCSCSKELCNSSKASAKLNEVAISVMILSLIGSQLWT